MNQAETPQLTIASVGAASGGDPWRLSFSVGNAGVAPVQLLEAWMPHVVVRAPAQHFAGMPALAPGTSVELAFSVDYHPRKDASEPANPFVILRVRWRGADWRVLTQLALSHGDGGAPVVQPALTTAHRVGFSVGL
jgi:hypothetical protein